MLAERDVENNSGGKGESRSTAEVMVDMYLKEPVLARAEEIHFLKKSLWPCLSDLACKYLSIAILCSIRVSFSSAADTKKESNTTTQGRDDPVS